MGVLIPIVIVISSLVIVIITMLLGALIISTGRVNEINKQLMIIVAGKDAKPETLRALVASSKPPQGKLKGIATGEKEDKKPVNKDYTMVVGGNRD